MDLRKNETLKTDKETGLAQAAWLLAFDTSKYIAYDMH
jgi:hypothetical protein